MATGRRLRLRCDTIGTVAVNDKATALIVPEDAVIELRGESVDGARLDVIWEGQVVTMFTRDIRERGEEL